MVRDPEGGIFRGEQLCRDRFCYNIIIGASLSVLLKLRPQSGCVEEGMALSSSDYISRVVDSGLERKKVTSSGQTD